MAAADCEQPNSTLQHVHNRVGEHLRAERPVSDTRQNTSQKHIGVVYPVLYLLSIMNILWAEHTSTSKPLNDFKQLTSNGCC